MKTYRATISGSGGYAFSVASEGHTFTIDPDGKGISPPAALLASLGSCIGVYLRKYEEGSKLDFGDFTVDVEGTFTPEKPVRFAKIAVAVRLGGQMLDDKRMQTLLAFIKNCPVHNTLEQVPVIDFNVTQQQGEEHG